MKKMDGHHSKWNEKMTFKSHTKQAGKICQGMWSTENQCGFYFLFIILIQLRSTIPKEHGSNNHYFEEETFYELKKE